MPDQKITVTDEMVSRARESLRSDGWTVGDGDTGLRAAITVALDAAPTTDEPDRGFMEAAADDWHSAAVQASGEALAAASRARRAETALEDLREQYGTAVREKDEWEANAEAADARAEKAEQERDEARKSLHEAVETVTSLRAMTARVYALHLPAGSPAVCQHCTGSQGTHPAFPCETIRALAPEEETR